MSVEQWEWILGGKAVRVTQSVNDGELGMQYTYFIDPATHGISFNAVSTIGFYSKGTLAFADGKMTRREKVIGGGPVSDVKVVSTLLSDGTMKSSSKFFNGGKRVPGGHGFQYHVAPDAKVIFASEPR